MAVNYYLIGQRIQKKRQNKGYTQEQMAEHMEVSVGYISQLERGITKINLDRLSVISDYLDCEISSLIDGSSIQSANYLDEELHALFSSLKTTEKYILFRLLTTYQEALHESTKNKQHIET